MFDINLVLVILGNGDTVSAMKEKLCVCVGEMEELGLTRSSALSSMVLMSTRACLTSFSSY
jgi:hypothetical protein